MEWNVAIAGAALTLNVVMVLLNNARQSSRVDEKTASIGHLALEAKKIALAAHERLETASAAAGLYREMIAREMVGKEEVRSMRAEIMAAIDKLDGKLERVYEAARHTPAP